MRIQDEKRAKQNNDNKMRLLNAKIERKNGQTDLYRDEDNLRKEINVQDDNTIVLIVLIMKQYKEHMQMMNMVYDFLQRTLNCINNKQISIIKIGYINERDRFNFFQLYQSKQRRALVVKDLITYCQPKNYSDFIIVYENRREPDGLIIYHMPQGPQVLQFIFDLKMQSQDMIQKLEQIFSLCSILIIYLIISQQFQNIYFLFQKLIVKEFSLFIMKMVLFHLDIILFKKHLIKLILMNKVQGLNLNHIKYTLGTIVQKEIIIEWQLRTFINTAGIKKKVYYEIVCKQLIYYQMDSKIIPLQNIDEFKSSILIEERVAILIFTAEWCQPSLNLVTLLKKELDQQRKRLNQQTGIINIFIVDHEKEACYQIVKQFAPTTLPYVYLFEKGKYIAQFGGLDVFAMNKLIKKALESSRAL